MTRSFQVDTASKQADSDAYNLGHDEAGLIASVQANPKSDYSSRARSSGSGG
jgi:hypothetical protein